jgi:hypothetical protein
MKSEFFIADNYRMAGVCAAGVSDNDIRFFREDIDNLPLTFITPLQPHYTGVHNNSNLTAFFQHFDAQGSEIQRAARFNAFCRFVFD